MADKTRFSRLFSVVQTEGKLQYEMIDTYGRNCTNNSSVISLFACSLICFCIFEVFNRNQFKYNFKLNSLIRYSRTSINGHLFTATTSSQRTIKFCQSNSYKKIPLSRSTSINGRTVILITPSPSSYPLIEVMIDE